MASKIKTFSLTKFNDIKDVAAFCTAASKINSDVRVFAGRYIVDAKSILGVTSIMLEKDIMLEIAYSNEAELTESVEILSAWIIQ